MKDLEQYLRDNKPVVKDDPTFLLETRHRLEAVEGIKGEVDRQRRSGRKALVAALAGGLAVGAGLSALGFLYPVNPDSVGQGILDSLCLFVQHYREYLLLPTALLAIGLGLVLFKGKGSLSGSGF